MGDIENIIKEIKEISIAIDNWDDIFSDFDPRPLNERTLSEDFINELKKRHRETRWGKLRIVILAPENLRSDESEKNVIQRLKREFRYRYLQKNKEVIRIRRRGILFVLSGILSLGLLTFITYKKFFTSLTVELLGIILMPLGWFGIWEGFSKIIDTSPIIIQEELLFNKLSKAEYRFVYE